MLQPATESSDDDSDSDDNDDAAGAAAAVKRWSIGSKTANRGKDSLSECVGFIQLALTMSRCRVSP
jgi:hypothetical protein